jgi:hypothetical protein
VAGGAIRVEVPTRFFLHSFVDIVSFKQSPLVQQVGKFAAKPRLSDLDRLNLDLEDLEALKRCRIGDCDIQLGAEQIQRVQAAIDWAKPDAPVQASRAMRQLLFEYVERYRTSGNRALLEYANDGVPVKVEDEARLLVTNSSQILAGLPEFSALLTSGAAPPHVDEFIYWSKEQFGLKPVITITHVIIYEPRRENVPDLVIASKQIYASRYLAGSLAITLTAHASSAASPSFYLIYVNRTRPRSFPPVVGAIARRYAQSEAREGLEQQLQLTKQRLETSYLAPAAP